MARFRYPKPVLDGRETQLIERLTAEYERFAKPGWMSRAGKALGRLVPKELQIWTSKRLDVASEWNLVRKTLEWAGKGFAELSRRASALTLTKSGTAVILRKNGLRLSKFQQICALRSYNLQQILSRRSWLDLFAALMEGTLTGAPGLLGLPLNIALSFLLYFRAVQSTALFYGYDAKDDPLEMEFAASVTVGSLGPTHDMGEKTLTALIGKMMFAANLTALRAALSKTYAEMARRGGSQLLYVQIRALANRAAQRALDTAGRRGLERSIFRDLLEQLGKRIPKEAGKKAVPLLGAIVGGLFDTYLMKRVLQGANLVYHKRFLFEKEERIRLLRQSSRRGRR